MSDHGWVGVDQIELAWAAGFFDGEGCTYLNRNLARHTERIGRPAYRVSTPTVSICQVDRRVLDRFVAAVGHGKVSGPYKPKTQKSRPYFRVEVKGRDRACAILTSLWPYLGEAKKEQAFAVWEKERQYRGPKSPPMPALPHTVMNSLIDKHDALVPR